MTDHFHVVNQPKERCIEYNIPLCIAFVDYEKAFDSVKTQAVLKSLREHGIEDVYIELLKEIYTNSSMTIHLHKESNKIKTRGLKIDGENLNYIRFADDILICANTPHELQQMLQELADDSENHRLKTNKSKIKVIMENDTPLYVNNTQIENAESCIYLQHQSQKLRQGDSKKNHGQMDSIRQEPRNLQRKHGNMLEETSLQLMCTFVYDIQSGNMGTHTHAKNKLAAAKQRWKGVC